MAAKIAEDGFPVPRAYAARITAVAKDLTHFDADGKAAMVDVTPKDVTERVAIAQGTITMRPETLALIVGGSAAKGDVLGVARLAGIMAAKRTSDLIPLCHQIPLSGVSVELVLSGKRLVITASARCLGQTGVEMEALTAASVAALTVYDMLKAVSHDIVIKDVRLCEKTGGTSDFRGQASIT